MDRLEIAARIFIDIHREGQIADGIKTALFLADALIAEELRTRPAQQPSPPPNDGRAEVWVAHFPATNELDAGWGSACVRRDYAERVGATVRMFREVLPGEGGYR